MNTLINATLRLVRPGTSMSPQQRDALIRAAAVSELRNLLNDDLYSLIRILNRPLILMQVPANGWWYGITGRGLRMLNANTVNTPNLGTSVSVLTTWDMYSETADLSTVFTIMMGLNGNNPLATYNRGYEMIRQFAVDGPNKSFTAQTRRSSR